MVSAARKALNAPAFLVVMFILFWSIPVSSTLGTLQFWKFRGYRVDNLGWCVARGARGERAESRAHRGDREPSREPERPGGGLGWASGTERAGDGGGGWQCVSGGRGEVEGRMDRRAVAIRPSDLASGRRAPAAADASGRATSQGPRSNQGAQHQGSQGRPQ